MASRVDPFRILERNDKWFLGGGRATQYAPPFPKSVDTPGFWDETYFADIRLERLFCVLVMNEQGRPLTLHRALRRWTPDKLTQIYTIEGLPYLQIQEERVVTPNDTFISRLTLRNRGTTPLVLHLLQWSLQARQELIPGQAGVSADALERDLDAFSFAHRVMYGASGDAPAAVYGWGERKKTINTQEPYAVYTAIGGSRLPDSWTANLAEATDLSPLWQTSLFPEKFASCVLPGEMQWDEGVNIAGHLHLAMQYTVEVPAEGSEVVTFGASVALHREQALDQLRENMIHDPIAWSRQSWEEYFDSVPSFECSDTYLETYYWYRWYGLRLNTVNVEAGNLPYPCVFEGIAGFRSHIAYSAQCHIRETAWMHDQTLAKGCLLNFLANQTLDAENPNDGFLPGHLYMWREDRGFYHADWGGALLQIYYLSDDLDFIRQVYPYLARYAEYFDRVRDREGSGLYDVLDQGETGQEYMSRYLFANPDADKWGSIQVKGVDATVYLYRLQRALAYIADRLKQREDSRRWDEKAVATRDAIRAEMWDDEAQLFKDVHPKTREQSPYKTAVGFYPFIDDIARPEHLGAWRHLDDSHTFGTPFPVPACSVDDPYFDAEAEWKGKRHSCPWNGRVWLMTNSHVLAALSRTARHLDERLKPKAVAFLMTTIRMLFTDGDPKRPNSYEHYNPYNGVPSLYRGIDDYQHSWIVDAILQMVAGVQPEPGLKGRLVIDPLAFPIQSFRVERLHIRGRWIDVMWGEETGFHVRLDGVEVVSEKTRKRVEITL